MADTLSCQWETLHSQQLRSIKKSIDSDHGIYRDLRNVGANYPFESSRGFSGSEPNSGHGDHSRLSCDVGGTQLGPSAKISAGCLRGRWSSRRIAELARIAAIGDANCEDRLKRSARPCRENPAAA